MKIFKTFLILALITIVYLAALLWADSKNHVFSLLPNVASALPIIMCISLFSYFLRYLRWIWLLKRAGSAVNKSLGFVAYLSGFAFTATPGKAGELLRIRYFIPFGVQSSKVISVFIYERLFDLLAVLLLASLSISRMDVFLFVTAFVILFACALALFAFNPQWFTRISIYFRIYKFKRLAKMCLTLRNGLSGCRIWLKPLDICVSLFFGLISWGLTSLAFIFLLNHLNISIPLLSALSIYPLAMLAGAASMLPGGIGSTEVTIVALLTIFNVQIGTATLAAIGIRFSTIWFAVICGFIALSILEYLFYKKMRLL